LVKLGTLTFVCCSIQKNASACTIDCCGKGCVQGNVTSLNFWEITDGISETVQDKDILSMEE